MNQEEGDSIQEFRSLSLLDPYRWLLLSFPLCLFWSILSRDDPKPREYIVRYPSQEADQREEDESHMEETKKACQCGECPDMASVIEQVWRVLIYSDILNCNAILNIHQVCCHSEPMWKEKYHIGLFIIIKSNRNLKDNCRFCQLHSTPQELSKHLQRGYHQVHSWNYKFNFITS